MRTMLRITIPAHTGNKAIQDGSLPRVVQSTIETLRPEAAYFFAEHGKRTSLMVFDLKDPSQIPVTVEPLFMAFDAEIELTPVMNAQDLQAGLSQVARK
jgi:hypothetical protein